MVMSAFSAVLMNPGFAAANFSPTKASTKSPTKSFKSRDSVFPKALSTITSSSTLASRIPPNPPLGGTVPHWSDEERIWISRIEGWKWQTWGYDSKLKEWRAWLPKKALEKMGMESLTEGKWVRFAAWPEDDDNDDDEEDNMFFTKTMESITSLNEAKPGA